jgi:hypothetical protein
MAKTRMESRVFYPPTFSKNGVEVKNLVVSTVEIIMQRLVVATNLAEKRIIWPVEFEMVFLFLFFSLY